MEILGVAVVGTGQVAGEHIRAYCANPRTEVRAIVSRNRDRGHAKAEEYRLQNCRGYDHLEEMLEAPGIHIVSICTPHHLHAVQGIACAKAGKHLLLEKPAALTLEDLRNLQAAVSAAKVRTLVSFVLRWNPLFRTIRSLLAEGVAGKLFYAQVDYFHAIGPKYPGYEWNIRKAMGGSSLLSAGCHAVDGLRWFMGKNAVEVFALANVSAQNPLHYEYEPNSVTLVKFEDGAIGKVASSLECVMPYTYNIELLGDAGTIRNNQVFSKRWEGQSGWATIPTVLPDSADVHHHPFQEEIDHFVDCIMNGRESHANLEDAALTHEICFASEISARENRPVRLPL
ncbi:MAG: Gfo/Idh/MocA family protein [Terriglobia bacterium]